MNTSRVLVEAFPRNVVSTPAQTSVTNVAGQLLASNTSRKALIIQNTGTTKLYLVYGSATPTTTAYHVALAACTAANDGTGGIIDEDAWKGAVQAVGSAAAAGTCVITEITGTDPLP